MKPQFVLTKDMKGFTSGYHLLPKKVYKAGEIELTKHLIGYTDHLIVKLSGNYAHLKSELSSYHLIRIHIEPELIAFKRFEECLDIEIPPELQEAWNKATVKMLLGL